MEKRTVKVESKFDQELFNRLLKDAVEAVRGHISDFGRAYSYFSGTGCVVSDNPDVFEFLNALVYEGVITRDNSHLTNSYMAAYDRFGNWVAEREERLLKDRYVACQKNKLMDRLNVRCLGGLWV